MKCLEVSIGLLVLHYLRMTEFREKMGWNIDYMVKKNTGGNKESRDMGTGVEF